MKRFLSMLLAVVMVLSMIPVMSFAAEVRTVYLDPASGADTNNGLSAAAPVQTVAAAYAALKGAQEGKITLLSTLTFTDVAQFPVCEIPVTITGSGITTANHIYFAGDTTLENITITNTSSGNTRYISAQGNNLTIGTGVSCKNGGTGYRFCLAGRHGEAGSVDGVILTVKSGSWRNIFAAGHTNATTGDATLIMTGGDVNNMIAPSYSGNVDGNVTMHISGKTGSAAICCAPNQTGNVTGNVNITLGGNVAGYLRVKSLSGGATVSGTATVTIDGDCTGLTEIKNVGDASGGINKTRLVLKSGALDVKPACAIDEIAVEIPEGETFTLSGCNISATSVNSAGTLIFSGAASLAAQTITGSLACDITGTVQTNHVYLTAPADSTVTFPTSTGVKGNGGVWQNSGAFDAENFKGLVLYTTVDGITVELYKDFSTDAANLVTPAYTDGKYQYYAVNAEDIYYGVSKPTNSNDKTRYELHQTFYISAAEANQKVEFDMTPSERSTEGWETVEAVCRFTDEVMQKAFPSDAKLWPQYQEVFTTPAFQPGRTEHRQTTQQEMEDFLKELDGPDDHIYVFNLGKTAMGSFNIPLVLVTSVKLPENVTLEQAAALIRADSEENGKLTVHYQAQIHGDEPAAGEAAMGMIKRLDGEYGTDLLDNLNVYVIPRLNPYGAYKGKRITWIDPSTYLDPNRDFINLRTSETQLRMKAFNLFEPEVVFDNHEYRFNLESKAVTKRDMMICSHVLPIFSEEYKETAIGLAYAAFNQLEEDNLTYSWYSSDAKNYSISSVSSAVGSGNTAYRGSMHILMETLGNNYGKNLYERRVASHVSAVTGILNHLDANADKVKAVVKAQQNTIVENGKTYKEDDVLAMTHQTNYHPEYNIQGKKVNLRNGGEVDFTFEARMADTVLRTRVAPTAYVIPAGESFTQRVLNLMDMQGIAYKFIPAGSAVMLQQYLGTVAADGTVSETTLTEDKLVAFPDGAYAFCMNQVDALILSCYMEPDYATTTETLARQGIITPTDGAYPIYRYIHDLNEDDFIDYAQAPEAPTGLTAVGVAAVGGTGKITGLDATKEYEYRAESAAEYTAVTAGATEISDLPVGNYLVRYCATQTQLPSVDAEITVGYDLTEYAVYLDSASGSDTGNAYTNNTAAATYSHAKKQLDALMEYAPTGTTGVIRIVGSYELVGRQTLPAHSYPLLITGGTLVLTDTNTSNARRFFRMGGETTFDNITLKTGTTGSGYFLCADGHKLTVGKSVTTPANGSNYIGIMGGKGVYDRAATVQETDIRVLSGTWSNIYAGGYYSSVTGNATVTLSDCSVDNLTISYNGTTGGDVYYSLENVTVRTDLYCGNMGAANIEGDVTLVLGKGVNAANIYTSSKTSGNIGGTMTVVADGIDLSENVIKSKADTTTGTIGGLALVVNEGQLADVAESFITRDGVSVTLGCNQTESFKLPYDITLDLKGNHVAAINTNGKKLTVKDSATDDYVGKTYGTIPATVSYEAAENYLPITEDGKVSFHKYALQIKNVVLRPGSTGIYYQSFLAGGEKVKAQIKEFGVAMSLDAVATQEKITADTKNKTHISRTGDQWATGSAGAGMNGVVVKNIMKPDLTAEENNSRANREIFGLVYMILKDGRMISTQYSTTMQTVVEYMNSNPDLVSQKDIENLKPMYETYKQTMDTWAIAKLKEQF